MEKAASAETVTEMEALIKAALTERFRGRTATPAEMREAVIEMLQPCFADPVDVTLDAERGAIHVNLPSRLAKMPQEDDR